MFPEASGCQFVGEGLRVMGFRSMAVRKVGSVYHEPAKLDVMGAQEFLATSLSSCFFS